MTQILWKYQGRINLTIIVTDVLRDRWERRAKDERERILNSILTYIATADDYREKLAIPAKEGYGKFVSDTFIDAEKIEKHHAARVGRGYKLYDKGVREAYADEIAPGAFLEGVEAGKIKYAEAKYTLMGLGEGRILNYQAITKAVMFLFGYAVMYRYLDPKLDIFIGWENYCSPVALKFRRIGRPAFLSLLTQGLVISIYCTELPRELYPEWRDWRDLTISICNDYVKRMLEPMLNVRNGVIYCGKIPVTEVSLRLEVIDEEFYVIAEVKF